MIECQLCGTSNDVAARYCAAPGCGTALGGPWRVLRRRRPRAAGRWVPAPVVTALGAVVVAGLAFIGLSLTSGVPAAASRSPAAPSGGGQPTGTGAPPTGAGPGGPVAAGMTGTAVTAVTALPLAGTVSSAPRLPPGTTGCASASTVPDVARLDYPVSSRMLLAAGFPGLDVAEHSSAVPPGGTISVSPAQGSVRRCGTRVTLVYSSGPARKAPQSRALPVRPLCTLPPAGGSAAVLLARLRTLRAGDRRRPCALSVTRAGGYSATVPAGDVISEDPLPGATVAVRSAVVLTVSLGPATCVPPPVVGDPSTAAVAALSGLDASDGSPCGLAVVTTTAPSAEVPIGAVISQDPPAGTAVAPGAAVTLTVSSGPPTPAPSPSLSPPPSPQASASASPGADAAATPTASTSASTSATAGAGAAPSAAATSAAGATRAASATPTATASARVPAGSGRRRPGPPPGWTRWSPRRDW